MPRTSSSRAVSLLCVSLLAAVACGRSWESVGEVRGAVVKAGVIGQAPTEVERRLTALRFGEGRRLEVGSFQPDRARIEAQLRDSEGKSRGDYNVDVTVYFDSAKRADSVQVFTSATRPL
jgi:hypothetical protein